MDLTCNGLVRPMCHDALLGVVLAGVITLTDAFLRQRNDVNWVSGKITKMLKTLVETAFFVKPGVEQRFESRIRSAPNEGS